MTNDSITLSVARTIVAGSLAEGLKRQFKPLSVAVLDAGGHLTAFEREDGASNMRFQIAFGKAHGALALGLGSRALMNRAEQQPYFIAAATAAIGGSLIPVPGGVLVLDTEGNTIGAVGVSGESSDNDEAVAVAGVVAAGFLPQTG
ncbi:GlcG/HbpS family heme-binding protein [Jatrophihabitans sp. DSM 45814]